MQKKQYFSGRSPHNSRRRTQKRKQPKQSIHPSKFINHDVKVAQDKSAEYVATHARFTDFDLAEIIQKNLAQAGFETPSAIQDQTITLALAGKDVIGLANTGTGKTAAFLLPILDQLSKNRALESVLIMAPTRELAQQIDNEFRKFSFDMKLYSALCVGGMPIYRQIQALKRRPHVIIGTPGRLKDHIERSTLKLDRIQTFVLDEADRMLDMGFVNDIREIASQLPEEKQTLCFSATLGDGVKHIVHDFMKDPELVSVKITETNDHIYQDVVHYADASDKKDQLMDLLCRDECEKVIVFGETKFGVQRLADTLDASGITSQAIHGDKSQGQRNRALRDFKTDKVKVLVATDVAARGLDIPNVSHVINFDTPQTYDDYVHRIGRTGRGGKSGTAFTFVPAQRHFSRQDNEIRRNNEQRRSPATQQRNPATHKQYR